MGILYLYSWFPLSYTNGILGLSYWDFMPSWHHLFSKPWTVATYAWIHIDLLHLFVNIIALDFLFKSTERMSNRLFCTLLFLSCAFGALTYLVGMELIQGLGYSLPPLRLVGSSPIVYGFITFIVILVPRAEAGKYPWGSKCYLWHWLVYLFLTSIADAFGLFGTPNVGGLLSHLGGALSSIAVYLFMKYGYHIVYENEIKRKRTHAMEKAKRSGIWSLSKEELDQLFMMDEDNEE